MRRARGAAPFSAASGRLRPGTRRLCLHPPPLPPAPARPERTRSPGTRRRCAAPAPLGEHRSAPKGEKGPFPARPPGRRAPRQRSPRCRRLETSLNSQTDRLFSRNYPGGPKCRGVRAAFPSRSARLSSGISARSQSGRALRNYEKPKASEIAAAARQGAAASRRRFGLRVPDSPGVASRGRGRGHGTSAQNGSAGRRFPHAGTGSERSPKGSVPEPLRAFGHAPAAVAHRGPRHRPARSQLPLGAERKARRRRAAAHGPPVPNADAPGGTRKVRALPSAPGCGDSAPAGSCTRAERARLFH